MTAISVFKFQPCGYAQYTSMAAAIALTSAPASGVALAAASFTPKRCVITVEGAGIRWRDDGTDPTTTVGMPVSAGASFEYTGPMGAIKLIQQSASATINVVYYA